MYPKMSNPQDLLKWPFICIFEPLCRKQLDWQTTEPPQLKCPIERNLRFYDWSLHDGTMARLSTTLERTMSNANAAQRNLEVFLCNSKMSRQAIRNYHYDFQQCPTRPPFISSWKTKASDGLASDYLRWFQTSPILISRGFHR